MAGPVHVLSMQGKNLDKVDAHMQKEIKVEGREAPFWGFSARPSRYSEKNPRAPGACAPPEPYDDRVNFRILHTAPSRSELPVSKSSPPQALL